MIKSLKEDYNGFEIIKVNSLTEISSILGDWEKLLKDNNSKNPYIDPKFYKNLFNSRAGKAEPQIILFRKNNAPISLIVGWLKKVRIPLKLGYLKYSSPFLQSFEIEIGGVITDNNVESSKVTVNYLKDLLIDKNIELIQANHFSDHNIIFSDLKDGLGTNKKVIYQSGLEWIAVIRNSETGEKVDLHSVETTKRLAKQDRKILKYFDQELEIKVYKSLNEINLFIKEAEKISKKSYHHAFGVGIEDNEYWKEMFSAMAEHGYFRGYLLYAKGIPIAYYQGIIYKDIYFGFYKSYDLDYRKLSPGTYLFRKVVESLIQENVNIYHFGYGDAEFKSFNGTEAIEEGSFRFYGFTLSARTSKFLELITSIVHDNLMGVIKRAGLLDKMKKYWRSKLVKK